MKIVYIITRADAIGGASIHVRDMARAMRECGHDSSVLIGGTGEVTDALEAAGVPYRVVTGLVRELSPVTDVKAIFSLRKALAELKPDLVSAHTSKAGALGRIAAWSLGIPVIYTPHCWSFMDGFPKAGLYLAVERFVAPFGSMVVAVSEQERQIALDKRVLGPTKIVTVHNGMPDLAGGRRSEPGRSPVRMCMIGRFETQKDHATLMEALGELRGLDWSVDLVGDGPTRAEIEAMAADLDLRDRVNFLGYRSDVAEILKDAQIYLLISNWESFPRSILEAMRSSLPVIASDVGGVRESVIDGTNGFVVAKGNTVNLAAKIRTLIENADLRSQMGHASRELFEEKFSFESMFAKYLNLYDRMTSKGAVLAEGATDTVARHQSIGGTEL